MLFPFGFEGGLWDLIVLVPDLGLLFYLVCIPSSMIGKIMDMLWSFNMCDFVCETKSYAKLSLQYSHREIPISPARLGDTFCCLGDFLSFHRDNRYSQRDIQVTQRDVVTVHRA